MLSKLSRRRGLQLEALGSVLICTVMLADRFLFTLQDGFVLTIAIISAVLLTIGIRVVKRQTKKIRTDPSGVPDTQTARFHPSLERACAGRPFLFSPHFDLYIISVEAPGIFSGAYFCPKGENENVQPSKNF